MRGRGRDPRRTASRPAARSPASTASAPTSRAYMPTMFTADDLARDAARPRGVRSDGHLQSRQGVSHAAAVRRGARPVPRASGRGGRSGGAMCSRPAAADHSVRQHARGDGGRRCGAPRSRNCRSSSAAPERSMDWGRPPQRIDATLEHARAEPGLIAHQHGDLTATIEAGATLRDVNDALSLHGQWLPLDPPFRDRRRRSAASSRPTTAARCGTATARRAISSSASRSRPPTACSRKRAARS